MSEPTREQKMDTARTRMAELAGRFLERTAGDVATLRAACARVASGEPGPVGDIRHLAHRMVGTGATLGFERLSGLAASIERLAESCEPGVLPDSRWCGQVGFAIDALAAELAQLRVG